MSRRAQEPSLNTQESSLRRMHVLLISAAFPQMQIAEAEHALHLSAHLARHNLQVSLLTTQGARTAHGPVGVYPI